MVDSALTPSPFHQAIGLLVLLFLILCPGYALLRLLDLRLSRLPGLAVAMGLGYTSVVPLFLVEAAAGSPPFVGGMALVALAWLRPGREAATALRGWARELVVPLAAAVLAVVTNAGDLRLTPEGGLSFRIGFDVSDRVFYAAIGQELLRAPIDRIENPVFAGLPLQYSVYPSALAAVANRYAHLDTVPLWLVLLPAFGLFWTAAAAMGFAEVALGAAARTRVLAALLVVLGGDLSFLMPAESVLQRTEHFFVFHSFSAEALFYNPWMLGAPLLLSALIALVRALEGSRGAVAAAGLLIGGLWPTKVFAFVCLTVAVVLVGVATRSIRLSMVALASTVSVVPWMTLALHTGTAWRTPLRLSPFYPVYALAAASPGFEWLGFRLGALDSSPVASLPGLFILGILCFAGGLGIRVLGLRPLVARSRREPRGVHLVVAVAASVGAVLGFSVVGRPTALDGTQFLMVALYLLWPYTAESLSASLMSASRSARVSGTILLVLATLGPLGYIFRKLLPEALTGSDAWDRRRFVLSRPALDACRWLREHAPPGARLVVPLLGDREGGLLPLHVAATAARRVSAALPDFAVSPETAYARRLLVERLFEARGSEDVERVLEALGADWVWETQSTRLAGYPDGLELRFASERVRVYGRRLKSP